MFAHVLVVAGFFFAHGTSAAVGFQLRHERSSDAIKSLMELSSLTSLVSYGFIALIMVTGILLGFQGSWWSRAWIWTALAILIITTGLMGGLARRYYAVRKAAGVPAPKAQASDQTRQAVARTNPWPISVIGAVALIFLLWLMVLKPF